MKTRRSLVSIVMVLLMGFLSSCQSVPAERRQNCACLWEALDDPYAHTKGINA